MSCLAARRLGGAGLLLLAALALALLPSCSGGAKADPSRPAAVVPVATPPAAAAAPTAAGHRSPKEKPLVTPHSPSAAPSPDPEEALLSFLGRTQPGVTYEAADFGLELPGWTFFEAYAQTGDDDAEVPHYFTVRASGEVVQSDPRQELVQILARSGVFADSTALPADTLATAAVVLLGDAERLIDSDWLRDWRSDGRVLLGPPEVARIASGVRLSFHTFPQPMPRKQYFRWQVDLTPDGTVTVRRTGLP